MKNIGMVSDKMYQNILTSISKSHQHSYFEPEVLADLNQERELSSVFDKLLVTLCGKHQTNLQKNTLHVDAKYATNKWFSENKKRKNILTVSNSYE